MEPFTLVERSTGSGPHHLFDDVVECGSAKTADHDLQYIVALRENNPGMIVTAIPATNVDLHIFAAAGHATCELDTKTDSYASWKGYVPPDNRVEAGLLGEAIHFAKYHYRWNNEDFILYWLGQYSPQYVLKECQEGEHVLGSSKVTDQLIRTIGDWLYGQMNVVWVYDLYWRTSRALYDQVMKSSWDDVILDESMKKELAHVANKFFSSKDVYEDLGVPWKRGLMFYGPPGNGKTISIRALMHELYSRKDPIPTLYVKTAPFTWDISAIFRQARALAPCMLILEDVETIVTQETRSYFFNEMDGLENNDGLFVVASTNYLDKLDPGLTKRPSRFDRKYKFPLPNEHERVLYCEFWRRKLKPRKDVEFPKKLCPPMAAVTDGFSFAFLQECFVATLLVLARGEEDEESFNSKSERKPKPFDGDNDNLEDYKLWNVFKEQADILRKEVEGAKPKASQLSQWLKVEEKPVEAPTMHASNPRDGSNHHGCCQCHADRRGPKGKGSVRPERRVGGESLPDLPWLWQKGAYYNSAIWEYKL